MRPRLYTSIMGLKPLVLNMGRYGRPIQWISKFDRWRAYECKLIVSPISLRSSSSKKPRAVRPFLSLDRALKTHIFSSNFFVLVLRETPFCALDWGVLRRFKWFIIKEAEEFWRALKASSRLCGLIYLLNSCIFILILIFCISFSQWC